MLRSYKYRIYPNVPQAELLVKHFGCSRWVWNWALEMKIKHYAETGKNLPWQEISAMLPVVKKNEETKWLGEVSAQAMQQVLVNLDRAYRNFFEKRADFPKFKKRSGRSSCRFPQGVRVLFSDSTIELRKLGPIRASLHRSFIGTVKSATVSRDPSGKFYASILVETGVPTPSPQSYIEQTAIGLDLGLAHFAILSDGTKVDNPRFLRASLDKLAREQRKLSRKVKGSNNRNKQRIRVARAHERVRFQRQDFLHKLSSKLIRENQAVAIEDLNVKGMLQHPTLAKSISDASWSEFTRMLDYKASWYGKTILRIGRFEPSSKMCTCGVVNRELKLSNRIWVCPSCGTQHDRDVLAANNIKRFALSTIGQGMPDFKPVESAVSKTPRRSRKSLTVLG